MGKIIDYGIPLAGGLYLLLLTKGVIKLNPEKQQRFDAYLQGKKQWIAILCYALIGMTLLMIAVEFLGNGQ